MSNINGYCPNCKTDLDGDLVIDTFNEMYENEEEAKKACTYYAGYEQYLFDNKWNRAISVSNQDSHKNYQCPDCNTNFTTALDKIEEL